MTETIQHILRPALAWIDGKFQRDVVITVDRTGMIAAIEHEAAASPSDSGQQSSIALLPGFVNAHSHAFQRGLRGLGEMFPAGAGSFWTWREEMYKLVERIKPDEMYELCTQAFSEMLDAGITTVGEFHYLHHNDAEARDYAFDAVVLRAAADVGIRIVLLQTFYNRGGFGRNMEQGQRRFFCESVHEYWQQYDRMAANMSAHLQSLGVVAHSIRAADLADIIALSTEAAQRGVVFHMHVEEQPAEIAQCVEHHGMRPLALLNKELAINERFTSVHCTHSEQSDMARYLQRGGRVCICPLTEANLGDGIARVRGMIDSGARICLGTDSNARISMIEEMRWLEYGQRLAREQRGVCIDESGRWTSALIEMATAHGADALGLQVGSIAQGRPADFCAVDLDHPMLQRVEADSLAEAIITGTDNCVVLDACVQGRWRHQRV